MESYEKLLPREIEVGVRPRIIVGQNPSRAGIPTTPYVWEDNVRSSKVLLWALDGISNVILTNRCNHLNLLDYRRCTECLDDLERLIDERECRLVICLGSYSYVTVTSLKLSDDVRIFQVYHPSFVSRFQKDRQLYRKQLRDILLR